MPPPYQGPNTEHDKAYDNLFLENYFHGASTIELAFLVGIAYANGSLPDKLSAKWFRLLRHHILPAKIRRDGRMVGPKLDQELPVEMYREINRSLADLREFVFGDEGPTAAVSCILFTKCLELEHTMFIACRKLF